MHAYTLLPPSTVVRLIAFALVLVAAVFVVARPCQAQFAVANLVTDDQLANPAATPTPTSKTLGALPPAAPAHFGSLPTARGWPFSIT